MEDVTVEVNGVWCRLWLISREAKDWGRVNFDREDWIVVDIWHCANHVRAIEAEGMSVPAGTHAKLAKTRRRLLAVSDARSDRSLRRRLSHVLDRLRGGRRSSDDTPDSASSIGIEMWIIRVFSSLLISVVLAVRLWHLLEPLLTEVRQWWVA